VTFCWLFCSFLVQLWCSMVSSEQVNTLWWPQCSSREASRACFFVANGWFGLWRCLGATRRKTRRSRFLHAFWLQVRVVRQMLHMQSLGALLKRGRGAWSSVRGCLFAPLFRLLVLFLMALSPRPPPRSRAFAARATAWRCLSFSPRASTTRGPRRPGGLRHGPLHRRGGRSPGRVQGERREE
jgi:hypothetical protein